MKQEDYYEVMDWKGYENYQCRRCRFSTLEKKRINMHVVQHMKDDRAVAARKKKKAAAGKKKG